VATRDSNATFGGLDDLDDLDVEESQAPEADRFEVRGEVARGGLGKVLEAHDRVLQRPVALKTLLRDRPDAHARFQRETLLTARLQHPNIVPVYDGGLDAEGLPYLSMRLVHGRTLEQAIAEAEGLAGRLELLPAVVDACHAVAYAHSQRIVHRDLKPDNVLVGAFGETVVIDWGLAKDLDAPDDDPAIDLGDGFSMASGDSLTRVGSVVGTPAYMPPEQAAGQPVDAAADVYSLGAVLYHTLLGQRPYADADDIVAAVIAGGPEPLRRLLPAVPRDLAAIVERAMARRPADRYDSAEALARDLERFRAGGTVLAHRYSTSERLQRFIARHPAAIGLGTVLVLSAVASGVLVDRAAREADRQRLQARIAQQEVEALEDAERRRIDELTVDQADLVVHDDPGRALQLLAGLSEQHRFDGRIRNIATAAWSARPPFELAPLGDGPPTAIAWTDAGPVVAWGPTVARYDAERQLRDKVPIGVAVRQMEALGAGVVVCTSAGLSWVPDQGAPEALSEVPCVHLSPAIDDTSIATLDNGELMWVRPGESYRLSTEPAHGIGVVTTAGGQRTVVLTPEYGLVVHDLARGITTSYPAPIDTYSMVGARFGDAVYLLGGATPLIRLAWDGPRVTLRALPVETDWLEHGTQPHPDYLVVAGAEARVTVVDPVSGEVTWQVPLSGAPSRTASLDEHRVLVGTEDGRLYVVDVRRGTAEQLASTEHPVLQLAVSPDRAEVMAATRAGVRLHDLRDRDGQAVASVPGRIFDLEPLDDGSMVVMGTEGAVQVAADGTLTTWSDQEAHGLERCGERWWFSSPAGLYSRDGRHAHPASAYGRDLHCVDDQLVATFIDGSMVRIDAATGELLAQHTFDETGRVAVWTSGDRLVYATDQVRRTSLEADPTMGAEVLFPFGGVTHGIEWGGAFAVTTRDGTLWLEGRATPLGQLPNNPTQLEASSLGLFSADTRGSLLWWPDPQQPPQSLDGHHQFINHVVPHPSQPQVASAGWDRLCILWDLDTRPVHGRRVGAHPDAVLKVAWSTDGRWLYTADKRGAVRRWSDPLARDPTVLRRQVDALAEAVAAGRPLPDADALRAMLDSP
jgi:outer membrane protein assembly factor BamB